MTPTAMPICKDAKQIITMNEPNVCKRRHTKKHDNAAEGYNFFARGAQSLFVVNSDK